jgi:hypothetical protein
MVVALPIVTFVAAVRPKAPTPIPPAALAAIKLKVPMVTPMKVPFEVPFKMSMPQTFEFRQVRVGRKQRSFAFSTWSHIARSVESTTTVASAAAPEVVVAPTPAPSPAPTPMVASRRCPVHTDYVQGGVNAENGEVGALEAEHDNRIVMVLAESGRCVTVEIVGPVTVSGDGRDVLGVNPGGRLEMTDVDGGPQRHAEIQFAGGPAPEVHEGVREKMPATYMIDGVITTDESSGYPTVSAKFKEPAGQHQYFVDGKEQPWDQARDWFHNTLADVIRETAFDARQRVVTIRKEFGTQGVLHEIRRTRNESARRQYFRSLIESGPLSEAERAEAAVLAESSLGEGAEKKAIVEALRGIANR